MQSSMRACVFLMCAVFATAQIKEDRTITKEVKLLQGKSTAQVKEDEDRTITKVVTLLQGMLKQSKTEDAAEAVLYGKFKCFCDGEDKTKSAAIAEAEMDIELLSSQIEQIKGENGELSSDLASIAASLAKNVESENAATGLRTPEHTAYNTAKGDLEGAVASMDQAMAKLAEVGADQAAADASSAGSTQFLGGHKGSLLSLNAKVSEALVAAKAFMSPDQKKTVSSLLQDPFTGTYTSQSAQVVGILKNMRDTFKANLAETISTETESKRVYDALIANFGRASGDMVLEKQAKEGTIGANDGKLSTAISSLSSAKTRKSDDEGYLVQTKAIYATKTKAFENRKLLRANEDAAIAKCISILNNDEAFETFGKTTATTVGATAATGLAQMAAINRHMVTALVQTDDSEAGANEMARRTAMQAIEDAKSPRLSAILAALKLQKSKAMLEEGDEPEKPSSAFDTVLVEIDQMKEVIEKEGAADTKSKDFCVKERKEQGELISNTGGIAEAIAGLNSAIGGLDTVINDPQTGLVAAAEADQNDLASITKAQKEQTEERLNANVLYQKNVKHLVKAQSVLTKAVRVLKTYYDELEAHMQASTNLIQGKKTMKKMIKKDLPAPDAPDTWDENSYEGQKSNGGDDAVGMLEFILEETKKEETQAHDDERIDQHSYEDAMAELKRRETAEESSLVQVNGDLATKNKELVMNQANHKRRTKEQVTIENYLLSIKAGCDFMIANIAQREINRVAETKGLNDAKTSITNSPLYANAVIAAQENAWEAKGCLAKCQASEVGAACKACLAGVTVEGYCVSHPTAADC